jgi:hypothetical protein
MNQNSRIGEFVKRPCPECGAPGRVVASSTLDPVQDKQEGIAGIAQCANNHPGYYFGPDDVYKYLIPLDE